MARDNDSEFQINFDSNGFINRLKAFVIIGVMPYSMLSNTVEFSPIDVTAKSIVALAKAPKECRVFHPYQHHTICFGDIIDIIEPLGLNIGEVSDVRIGKYLEVEIADTDRDVDTIVKEMCEKVLTNTVIEKYRYEIEEA